MVKKLSLNLLLNIYLLIVRVFLLSLTLQDERKKMMNSFFGVQIITHQKKYIDLIGKNFQ